MQHLKYPYKRLRHIISAPIIYSAFVPLIIFDVWMEIYHRICFPLYGISYIKRSQYIKIDRHKLSYLTLFQKMNCMYCGYANGALNYWSRIAAISEHYWCGIQHQKSKDFKPPAHHKYFAKFNDEEDFNKKYKK